MDDPKSIAELSKNYDAIRQISEIQRQYIRTLHERILKLNEQLAFQLIENSELQRALLKVDM